MKPKSAPVIKYEQSQLRALRAAQQAAHRVMDYIDATRGLIPAYGSRTASHPMATRIDPPQTRGPQEPATTIPDGCATCSGLCQSPAIMATLTQVAQTMEQTAHDLADLNIRLALLEDRVNALSQLLEMRVLNKEKPT